MGTAPSWGQLHHGESPIVGTARPSVDNSINSDNSIIEDNPIIGG